MWGYLAAYEERYDIFTVVVYFTMIDSVGYWVANYASCSYPGQSSLPACQVRYSCPSAENPFLRIKSDSNGTPSTSGQYCTKPCIAPFAFEGNQCVTYCPLGESLDLSLGRCVGNQSVIPEAKQYCGNPVVINDGEKVQHEEPDLFSSGCNVDPIIRLSTKSNLTRRSYVSRGRLQASDLQHGTWLTRSP